MHFFLVALRVNQLGRGLLCDAQITKAQCLVYSDKKIFFYLLPIFFACVNHVTIGPDHFCPGAFIWTNLIVTITRLKGDSNPNDKYVLSEKAL